jgi:hypothetical protein
MCALMQLLCKKIYLRVKRQKNINFKVISNICLSKKIPVEALQLLLDVLVPFCWQVRVDSENQMFGHCNNKITCQLLCSFLVLSKKYFTFTLF